MTNGRLNIIFLFLCLDKSQYVENKEDTNIYTETNNIKFW